MNGSYHFEEWKMVIPVAQTIQNMELLFSCMGSRKFGLGLYKW
jgi:hypothetical protein